MFRLDDVTVSYGQVLAPQGGEPGDQPQRDHRLHRPLGLRQEHLIRCLNRMNDLIPGARVEGKITYHGQDLYGDAVDPVEVRRRIGMVFQKPFPKSIHDSVAVGPKVIGMRPESMDELVERSLRAAALWDEVKDKLRQNALSLSGGLAAAALHRPGDRRLPRRDPDGQYLLGPRPSLHRPHPDLMEQLKRDYTIVIVRPHAAGGPDLGPHGLAHRRGRRGRWQPHPGCWSSTTAPTLSSPSRPTSGPRTTSPGVSGRPGRVTFCVLPNKWEDA